MMMETACSPLQHLTQVAQKEKGLHILLAQLYVVSCFFVHYGRVTVPLHFVSSHKKNTKKNRMKVLFAAVTEAREAGTGRRLCDLFMVKPSKKDYPDYYKVILEPMDLRTIEHNIRSDKYMTEDAMVEDMKLMFRNARHYNEEGSQVRSVWCYLSNVLFCRVSETFHSLKSTFVSCCKEESTYESILKCIHRLRWKFEC